MGGLDKKMCFRGKVQKKTPVSFGGWGPAKKFPCLIFVLQQQKMKQGGVGETCLIFYFFYFALSRKGNIQK